jgi:methionine--tRNA ligase beta chain
MDFRIGKIIECEVVAGSENLYKELIDIGNGEIRTIASGLQKYVKIEDMKDKLCVVLVNLKPRNLGGLVTSHGMVLCSEKEDKSVVELLQVPEGSQAGDLISVAGFERKPPAELNAKKNPWDSVATKLKIDSNGFALFEDIKLTTEKGPIKSQKVTDGIIK